MEEGLRQLQSQWPYTSGRFHNGLVGLYNDGLTCCVNALLQTFYLTPEFTSTLQQWDQMQNEFDGRNIPYCLCRLFDQMRTSKTGKVSAESFLHCLRLNHVKAYAQNDAAELFLTIFNLLLDQLQTPHIVEEMKRLFEIKVEQFVKCQCDEVTVRDNKFWSLPVPVKETQDGEDFTLEDGLEMFFSSQPVRRNNRCSNHVCKMKSPALQDGAEVIGKVRRRKEDRMWVGFKLISVPEILNLHLNRFRAPSNRGGFMRKIYSLVTFPETLNLNQFPISERSQKYRNPQESWQYQLYAVLVHIGSASFGHYIVCVKSFKDSMWYGLNDSNVFRVNWADITQTFGGPHSKSRETAYMLLYRRVKTEDTIPPSGAQADGL
ncbi:ubl carboxyl-terminal hydrolase 18 isoform X2 [Stegostoma tigrinum]|uniref:ubl carboxyl-terminal hydrolase 18 isoform X2 n=1 Tax=Stegostoma tigrinum TaxID=3053191 RepID=UPI00202B19F1|nr:ubl carboxyl-terminal hydrolase 18 isoform X2 [Stegostoma tigrinum]XP_048404978.1 ubl carboxyl-terminal hydrolase 18 isoform X2 [Stegostoma tigrinum]XP_048404979.1 ubl carboxyl-terminal hydrolase 18 isoform X2 [Stegostoma tigrinum]XP_048404980.1 ubl carboxyl-terminal hydrolase 18 isoform X2 [Stegostoma tigrinum]XP_048404981.1 ubl carboxyl-terminal hydrolase 18 isoform X2 [Stegostoma tigrinum]XP_048404982.1 ubl carboxyl-terminal hydrolase 18 isoform X2 [Stegostoma tigrinum]